MKEQAKEQTQPQGIVNGINVDELFGTIDAIKNQPELAKFQFRASNKWVNGSNNRTTINGLYGAGQEHERENPFVLEKDEPQVLLGTDRGANPVEYALTALAGCLTTTLVCFAAAQGIELNEVESKFEGDADLRGFLGLDENVRNGCDNIRITFNIKSDAPKEKIEELVELAQNRSGVFDMLANKVPISVELAS